MSRLDDLGARIGAALGRVSQHEGRPAGKRCAVCGVKKHAPCVLTIYDLGPLARYAILDRERRERKRRRK